jgi:hypothetical protein
VKVAKAKRRPRQLSPGSYMKMLQNDQGQSDRKAGIIKATSWRSFSDDIDGLGGPSSAGVGQPYHKVVMVDFEEVYRRGIKFRQEEFVAAKMSKKEMDMISKLAIGSAFRKWSLASNFLRWTSRTPSLSNQRERGVMGGV